MATRRAETKDRVPQEYIEPPECDVLLFVTTQTEQEQLKAVARSEGVPILERTSRRLGDFYDLGMIGESRVLAVKTSLGSMRYGGAARAATLFQAATGATTLVGLGMAFGVDPSTQAIGDVLVAEHVFPYDDRVKVTRHGVIMTEYPRATLRRCKQSSLGVLRRHDMNNDDKFRVRVHFGVFLSGGAQIRSRLYRDALVDAARRSERGVEKAVVGGDMEGVAMVAASDPSAPSWMIVKGISDFADEDRRQASGPGSGEARSAELATNRELACRNAIGFFLRALRAPRT